MRYNQWRHGLLLLYVVVLPTSLKALTSSYPKSCSYRFSTMGWTSTKLYNNNNKNSNWIGDDANKKDWDISDFWNALMNNNNNNNDDDASKKKKREEMENDNNDQKQRMSSSQRRERPRRERRSPLPSSSTTMNNNNNRRERGDNYMEEEEEQTYYYNNNRQKMDKLKRQIELLEEQLEMERYDNNVENDDTIKRYKTRCQLLEHVVSEVQKNNTILTNRVQILQDAIEKQKRDRQENEKKWNQTEAKLKLEYEQDCTQLMDLLDQEKNLRTKVKVDYQQLQKDFNKVQNQLTEQKRLIQQMEEEQEQDIADVYNKEEIIKLQQQVNRWKVKFEKEEKIQLQEKVAMNQNFTTTITTLEETIVRLQTELKDIQKTFQVREEIYKRTILSSKDQTSTIQKKLDDISKERNGLSQLVNTLQTELSQDTEKREELEEMITAMLSKENSENLVVEEGDNTTTTTMVEEEEKNVSKNIHQTTVELKEQQQQYEESMEIAKASVQAAEERELHWKQQVEVLQGRVDKLMNEKEQLNNIKLLLEEKVELQEESFGEKLTEANQKRDDVVRQLQNENQNLIQSFEEERETLLMDFTASNEEWKVKLDKIQRKYNQDILRFKSTWNNKLQEEEEYKTKYDDVGIALNFIPPQSSLEEDDTEMNSKTTTTKKKKGKWRRLIGRLKKPFQKPR